MRAPLPPPTLTRRAFARTLALAALAPACRPRSHPASPPGSPARRVRTTAPPAPPAGLERVDGPPPPTGDLPDDPDAVLDDLYANDLALAAVNEVNDAVVRLELARGPRTFRAKWKAMGERGSEVQDGYDGNNAPRCESAAFRLNRALLGRHHAARHLVAPVAVRALHRDVPCAGACAGLPRLRGYAGPATFPRHNDHLVLGALTLWIDGVDHPAHFHGGLWDPARFAREGQYRRSFSDLCLFLTLIAHGDANYPANFLERLPGRDRFYSIDNGRAFDGVPFYTGRGDPDWEPFAHLSPRTPVAPAFSRETLRGMLALDRDALARELRVTAAIELRTGRSLRDAADDPGVTRAGREPLAGLAGAERVGRGAFVWRNGSERWLLLGVGEVGIDATLGRARALAEVPTFD